VNAVNIARNYEFFKAEAQNHPHVNDAAATGGAS
jgi:hypothetical protein